MIRGLIVTHGRIGDALVSAVEVLLGPQDHLDALSNDGLSAASLREAIATYLQSDSGPLVVFADMRGGSCEFAARGAARQVSVVTVSGVNLPMLVEFCHYRARLDFDALVERVVSKGEAGITVSGREVGE